MVRKLIKLTKLYHGKILYCTQKLIMLILSKKFKFNKIIYYYAY